MVSEAAMLHMFLADWLGRYHNVPDAAFDVRCMIEQATGKPLEMIRSISPEQQQAVQEMAERRAKGEPLQYILGEWEFYGIRLFIGEGVLIPRPDTERLVEIVLERCGMLPHPRILDLCTGSGCIAIALKANLPGADVHAVELSDRALSYAKQNAAFHQMDITFTQGDVLQAETAAGFSDVDVIVSNPPYLTTAEMQHLQRELEYEPASALAAGEDGLIFYRGITRLWKHSLKPGALLAYEIGEQQGEAVAALLAEQGFAEIQVLQDYAHHDRVVVGRFV